MKNFAAISLLIHRFDIVLILWFEQVYIYIYINYIFFIINISINIFK
jgi:hypothetical protein